jgi:hypothetical protein
MNKLEELIVKFRDLLEPPPELMQLCPTCLHSSRKWEIIPCRNILICWYSLLCIHILYFSVVLHSLTNQTDFRGDCISDHLVLYIRDTVSDAKQQESQMVPITETSFGIFVCVCNIGRSWQHRRLFAVEQVWN